MWTPIFWQSLQYGLMGTDIPSTKQALKGSLQTCTQICLCPGTSGPPCSLVSVVGWSGQGPLNTRAISHSFCLLPETSASQHGFRTGAWGNMGSFFPLWKEGMAPPWALTSESPDSTYLLHENDEGCVVPLLCHQASVGRQHVEAPGSFARAHLGLGSVLLPQPVCAVVGHNPPVPGGY